jgi:phosphohistidine phosphatase
VPHWLAPPERVVGQGGSPTGYGVGMARELVILRHSKAEKAAVDDRSRSLNERGWRDAEAVGEMLARLGVEPQQALVSSAARARQTWEGAARGLGLELDPRLDDTLYSADEETALELIRATDDDVESLVVVGHNPTMAALAHLVDDGEGDRDAGKSMDEDFPTSAFAVFSLSGGWSELAAGTARLTEFGVGRG